MVCIETILGKIVEKIVDTVFQSVGCHVGFILHYKQNLKNLDDEENNLQKQRSSVQEKADEANHRGEAINNNVLDWLKDADETRQGVDNFRDENAGKENILCFNFSCPNFISRYRLSKQAGKVVVHVKHVTEEGGKIENGTVSHPKEAPPELIFPSSKDYEGFDSRNKVFEDIVKALKDPKVNRIGVYGTGGVGKTTMVTKVGELVKKDGTFDEVVTAVVSQDANVIKIQGQLADLLNLKLDGETEMGRATQLWNRLNNGKKNLIILDDVWQELDLNKIGIPITDGNKSCKVVLTSRKRDVWKNMDVKDFRIEILSEGESWTLFKKKVGNYVDAHHESHQIARAVCKECQGLPVAINAIGAALKGKDKDMYAWRDALDKLQNSMLNDIEGIDRQVYASLKWSFDRLDSEDAKSCFLLCCLFPEDAEIQIDDLVRYYVAGTTFHGDRKPDSLEKALDRVHTVVGTLKRCCLLLDEDNNEDVVKMHDVVRDVAISIAKGEKSFLVKHGIKDWPETSTYEHCSVISLRPHDMLECPDELVCPELHTLRLDCTDNEYQRQVPDRFFSGTENLTVLDLNECKLPILPASLAKLAKLQMLCLNECKLGDIAILKDLKDHLEILSLRRSDIEVLPPEVGELTRLRVLDMDDCDKLKVIPKGIISKLLHLEELYLPSDSFHLWEGTRADGTGRDIRRVSLDELMSLTRLTTLLHVCIRDPALFPKDFTFENLVRFNILVGGEGYSYSKDSTGVLKLENIHLANNLEGLLGKPKWCRQRNVLYPSKSFSHLTDLSITDCRLKYLFSPSSAKGLVQLKELEIERCMDMEGVIGNEGEEDHEDIIPISFSRLNELSLVSLPNLKSFYPKKEKTATSSESSSAHDAQTVLFTNKVAFPVIEKLNIESVPKVTEIWYKQNFMIPEKETESSFNQLRSMEIKRCDKLMNVVGGCPKMESIVTEKQKGLEVDDYVTRFPKLKFLTLENLLNLESFCSCSIRCEAQPLFDHQVAFPVLETLIIQSVPKVTEIWYKQNFLIPEKETESSFNQLWYMVIRRCDKLMNVVGGCPKMESIVTEKQKGLEVDHYVTPFPKLMTLVLENLLNLESFCSHSIRCEAQPLFDHQVAFPLLEELSISFLPNITDIWDKKLRPVESFCQLEELDVSSCSKLVNLVQSTMLPQLQNLRSLRLYSCPMVGGVVDLEEREEETQEPANNTIVPFPELTRMVLEGLQNIKGFCTITSEEQPVNHAQVAFPMLEDLHLNTLGEIALRQLLGAWEPSIKTLVFSKCDEISTVVSPRLFRRLRNVDLLRVESCIGVSEVFHFDELEVGEGQECVGSLIQVRKIQLNTLPKLTCLWNKDPHGNLCLQNLEYLTIKDCPLLRNLLTASVAKALGGLRVLYLRSCSTMEEVVFATDEVIDDEEIVFPKLELLILKDLSNLKSFCRANYNFNLPSLKTVVVMRCPNMQTFTSGSVCMPPTNFISRRGDDGLVIEDLNKHLQQRHLKGEEITAEGEMDGMYSYGPYGDLDLGEEFFNLDLGEEFFNLPPISNACVVM